MEVVNIYSQIYDPDINKHMDNSLIWKKCYADGEDLPEGTVYLYKIKFDGLKPIQLLDIKKIK